MTDRTVVYRLMADVKGLQAGLAAGAASTRKAAGEMGTSLNQGATKAGAALEGLGVNAATVGLALGTKVVMSAANFEQAMSGVQAATGESAANMDALKQAALDAGAQTAFSATEAAAGIENLAKAGVSTADILDGGLTGALDLAAAGELDVGQAAEIAATAMAQFKLAGDDVPRVADALAAGAGKAQGEVTDLSQALNQSGLVAGQMGMTLEETTGTLAAFAKAGLLGSDAGTSLKTMLLRLANPSAEAARTMERFGISAYDAQGNMRPMSEIAGQLQTAFDGQSQATRDAALATIFGSDAIRAANVLYSEGEQGVEGWTEAVSDSGFAAEIAATKTDNLKGKVEELLGSLETAMIGQGEQSIGPLSTVVDGATQATNAFNSLNGATEGWLTTITGGPVTLAGRAISDLKGAFEGPKTEGQAFTNVLDHATHGLFTAAESTGSLTTAAATLGQTVAKTEEQLKAEAEALQDAKDAARESATSFSNLGEALNDGKRSLGQWITQMANQADALNNFTANSEKAADRGLRKGLIAALQDAGKEGALRMRQLANGTKAELDAANAAWDKNQQAINRYVRSVTSLPPAKLDVDSTAAAAKLIAFRNSLDATIRDRIMTVTTVYKVVRSVTDALPDRGHAAGGYVASRGPGELPDVLTEQEQKEATPA